MNSYTFKELCSMIQPVPGLVKPTAKYLRENFEELCVSPDGSATCYTCGYIVFSTVSGTAVFKLAECKTYTYKSTYNYAETITEEQFANMNWYFPVIVYGTSMVEHNQEHCESNHRHVLDKEETVEDLKGEDFPESEDEEVRKILSCLSERQKDMFLLHKYYGYTHSEIAMKYGVSVSTVSNTIKTAKEKMAAFVISHKVL